MAASFSFILACPGGNSHRASGRAAAAKQRLPFRVSSPPSPHARLLPCMLCGGTTLPTLGWRRWWQKLVQLLCDMVLMPSQSPGSQASFMINLFLNLKACTSTVGNLERNMDLSRKILLWGPSEDPRSCM